MDRCALIVESDPNVRSEIVEVVESLGHQATCCSSQKTANELIATRKFTYIIAGILMRASDGGRSKNPDNCCHFLYQVHQILPKISIIITGPREYATKGYAAKLIRAGAFDFIDLPAPSAGRSLSESVRDALRREKKQEFDKSTVQNLTTGNLVFYDDRVELCGVLLTDADDIGMVRDFLYHLTILTPNGRRSSFGNDRLVKILKASSPQAVRSMISRLRRRIFVGLLKEKNIRVGMKEIIANRTGKGGGYHLADKVNIVFKTSTPENKIESGNTSSNNLSTRQQKIINFLCRQGSITKIQVEQICDCSSRTAQRELAFLRDEGYIIFVGHGARGRWRFKPDWRKKFCNQE